MPYFATIFNRLLAGNGDNCGKLFCGKTRRGSRLRGIIRNEDELTFPTIHLSFRPFLPDLPDIALDKKILK